MSGVVVGVEKPVEGIQREAFLLLEHLQGIHFPDAVDDGLRCRLQGGAGGLPLHRGQELGQLVDPHHPAGVGVLLELIPDGFRRLDWRRPEPAPEEEAHPVLVPRRPATTEPETHAELNNEYFIEVSQTTEN